MTATAKASVEQPTIRLQPASQNPYLRNWKNSGQDAQNHYYQKVLEVVKKLFPDTESVLAFMEKHRIGGGRDNIQYLADNGYQPLTVLLNASERGLTHTVYGVYLFNTRIVQFYHSYYPACCGIQMIHNFSTLEQGGEEVEQLLNAMFSSLVEHKNTSARRFEVVMVESSVGAHPESDTKERMELIEWKPIEKPTIYYKPLWDYFHKYAKKVNTRLMYNSNSGNLLHNMEVLF